MIYEKIILYILLWITIPFAIYFLIQFWKFGKTNRIIKETIIYVTTAICLLVVWFTIKSYNQNLLLNAIQARLDVGYKVINSNNEELSKDANLYLHGKNIKFFMDTKEIVVEDNENIEEYSFIYGFGKPKFDLIPFALFKDREVSKKIIDYINDGYNIILDGHYLDAQTSNGLCVGYEIKVDENNKNLNFYSRPKMLASCIIGNDGFPILDENTIQHKNEQEFNMQKEKQRENVENSKTIINTEINLEEDDIEEDEYNDGEVDYEAPISNIDVGDNSNVLAVITSQE